MGARASGAVAVLLGVVVATACRSERQAQLVVVISSDMRVPDELDGFRLRITGPDPAEPPVRDSVFALGRGEGKIELPTDFGVRPRGGDVRRRVTVEVSAMRGADELFTTRAVTTFLPHRWLRLDIFLSRSCIEQARLCRPDETCRREGCVPPEVDPETLPPFVEGQPLMDAGAPPDSSVPVDATVPPVPDAGVDAEVPEPVVPSNVPPELVPLAGELSALRVEDALSWSTDTGQIDGPYGLVRGAGEGVIDGIGFAVVAQATGPALGIFRVDSLEVVPGGSMQFVGGRAAVVLCAGDLVIGGRVSVAATGEIAGSGGGNGGPTDASIPAGGAGAGGNGIDGEVFAGDGITQDMGGGGGGYGADGGSAGQAPPSEGGTPGRAYGEPALSPLHGGSGGGSGAYGGNLNVHGGGGGGALQMFSRTRIDVLAGGVVTAAGGGGAGGLDDAGVYAGGGGGGGSGGGVLLEAPDLRIDGAVVANGGGGGGGGAPGAGNGQDGAPGRDDGQTAAGGAPSGLGGGRGGDGGAGSSPGGANGVDEIESGGGGGAGGRIRLNSTTGQATIGGIVSPDPSQGTIASP